MLRVKHRKFRDDCASIIIHQEKQGNCVLMTSAIFPSTNNVGLADPKFPYDCSFLWNNPEGTILLC